MKRRMKYSFRLFIAGDAPNSAQAFANLTEICKANLSDQYAYRSRGRIQGTGTRAGRGYFYDADSDQDHAGPRPKNRRHARPYERRDAGFGTGNPCSMSPGDPPSAADVSEEVAGLIAALHRTEQRLEELTAGEVDTVTDRDGRTIMLRHAQEQLRNREAVKQAAILNALPANIALLDPQGLIISVNEAWLQFGRLNGIQGPGDKIGVNYLEVCDKAKGDGASEAKQAAAGIRAVLDGKQKTFSLEYTCHSPTVQRWFLMMVTPMTEDHLHGVVVMHLDVTAKRQSEKARRATELKFRQMAENIRDVFFLRETSSDRILYVSPAYEEIWGQSCESLYANPTSWSEAIHPDDRALAYRKFQEGWSVGHYDVDFRIVRPDGSIRWIQTRAFPVRDDAGKLVRIAGVAKDITKRQQDKDRILQLAERLTTTLESITDAFFTVDREWRFTFLNREAERLLGRTRAELIGKDLWTEFPDAIGSTFEREYRQATADKHAVDFEEYYLPLKMWFGVRAYPSEQGLAVYFRDISETRRTAEELKFKNTMLLTQQETSLDAILVVDENENIIHYNQGFIDLWRLSAQMVSARRDAPVLRAVADQVKNPGAFVARVQYLYDHPTDKSHEVLLLKDGRIIDRYSAPGHRGGRRAITGEYGISVISPSASGWKPSCVKASLPIGPWRRICRDWSTGCSSARITGWSS